MSILAQALLALAGKQFMNSKWTQAALLLVVLIGISGCAHYPVNPPKTADSEEGYYYRNQVRQDNSEDILLLLAFSGGGTRAASFSYGLLEALRETTFEVDGEKRTLLAEVDAISSVSGGSVTAAAYALYGDRTFDVLEPAFLKRNVQGGLALRVLNPLHWPALWSPTYSRSDLAAEYYDKILFKKAQFKDLATNNTPFIIINATDISTGARIPFNQEVFDVFASDLGRYPLSRAVAASSAVPGLLAPITLDNHAGKYPVTAPSWVTRTYDVNAGAARPHAFLLNRFLNATNYPYLHLSDGGVSDNLGLRSYLDTISLLEANPEMLERDSLKRVRKVVFISVNAFVHKEEVWDRKAKTPGAIPVAVAADSRTMERYSEDTLLWFRALIEGFRTRQELHGKVDFYSIELDFTKFKDREKALRFLSLPTTFKLKDEVVDELKQAAHTLLYQNEDFQKLATDLGADHPGTYVAHPLGSPEQTH